MPPKSKAQAKFMRAVASGRARKKPKGLSRAEAKEFVEGHPTKDLPERKKRKKSSSHRENPGKSFGRR